MGGNSKVYPVGSGMAGEPMRRVICAALWTLFLSGPAARAENYEVLAVVNIRPSDAAFDTKRGVLYICSERDRTVKPVEVAGGRILPDVRSFFTPARIAVGPYQKWLYIATHMGEWGGRKGAVYLIDLDSGSYGGIFHIDLDASDLAVTTSRIVIASGASEEFQGIESVSLSPFRIIARWQSDETARIALHPDQRRLYCTTPSGKIFRLDLDPKTYALRLGSAGHSGHPKAGGGVFIHPGGEFLLTGLGGVFGCSQDPQEDLGFKRQLGIGPVNDVAFDAEGGFLFCVYGSDLHVIDDRTLSVVRVLNVPDGAARVGLIDRWIYVASFQGDKVVLSRLPNLGPEGWSNQAPEARFTWSAESLTAPATVTFDASSSSDHEDDISGLKFRWDWDSDGTFETLFSSDPVRTHTFRTPGTKIVTLQVKDSVGLTSKVTKFINIHPEEGPPPEDAPEFYAEIPYPVIDAAFDPVRSRLYVINDDRRILQVIEPESGLALRTYFLGGEPKCLALTPAGNWLYVGLGVVASGEGGGRAGRVLEVGLEPLLLNRFFDLEDVPFDMVATEDGVLVVSSYDDPVIRSYLADKGTVAGGIEFWPRWYLTLHQVQNALYVGGPNGHGIYKLAVEAQTGRLEQVGEPTSYANILGRNLYLDPYGPYLVTRHGQIFKCEEGEGDRQLLGELEGDPVNWVAFDFKRKALFVVRDNELAYYNSDTLLLQQSYRIPGKAAFAGASGDLVYVLSVRQKTTRIFRLKHPAAGSETNTPPSADFSWSPENPQAGEPVLFDAGLSSDAEQPLSELSFRWDWESDGRFDTAFSSDATAEHRYGVPGTKEVTLEVKDSFGLAGRVTKVLYVRPVPPEDPSKPSPIFELPFEASDALFDPLRESLYVLDPQGKRMVVLKPEQGLVTAGLLFDHKPRLLCAAPDFSLLYVATIRPEAETPEPPAGEPYADIVTVDPESLSVVGSFPVDFPLWNMLCTPSGYLIISVKSGPDGIASYDTRSGEKVSSIPSGRRAALALDGDFIIARSVDTYYRIDFDPQNGTLKEKYDQSRKKFCTNPRELLLGPRGGYTVDCSGYAYLLSPGDKYGDFKQYREQVCDSGALDFAGDFDRRAFFAVTEKELWCCNAGTLLPFKTFRLAGVGGFVGVLGKWVYVLCFGAGHTLGLKLENPALALEANTPPSASFTFEPSDPDTGTDIVFDASQSTDPEDPFAALKFRWDWEGDGVYDTQWLSTPKARFRYEWPGTKTVRLQVMDSVGDASEATADVNVSFDAGPDYRWFLRAFSLPEEVEDVLFDPERYRIYLAAPESGRVIVIDAQTGFTKHRFKFEGRPRCLTQTPSGDRLFVGMYFGPYVERGVVTEIEPESLSVLRTFEVDHAPREMVATDSGLLIVTSWGLRGSSFYSLRLSDMNIAVHDVGETIYCMALGPGQKYLFAEGSKHLFKFRLNAEDHDLAAVRAQEIGSFRPDCRLFVDASGERLYRGAGVYRISDQPEEDLKLIGVLEEPRPRTAAVDSEHNAIFAVDSDRIYYYDALTLSLMGSHPLPQECGFVGLMRKKVYMILVGASQTRAGYFTNPALGREDNLPPEPDFSWTPRQVDTLSFVTFDASLSRDDMTELHRLRFRWDWESDGTYDTEFTYDPVAVHCFYTTGEKRVTLEVMDQYGLRSQKTRKFIVVPGGDAGVSGRVHTPFTFPFEVEDAAFHPSLPYLYASCASEKRVVQIDLNSGKIVHEFPLGAPAGALTITQGGKRLYVAIPQCDPEDCFCSGDGAVAEFDLQAGERRRSVPLPITPGEIAATDGGLLIIAAQTGAGSYLSVYKVEGFSLADVTSIRLTAAASIVLHPSERQIFALWRFFAGDPAQLERLTLDPVTGDVNSLESVETESGVLAVDNEGLRVFTEHYVFGVPSESEGELTILKQWDMGASAYGFSRDGLLLRKLRGEPEIEIYDNESLELLGKVNLLENGLPENPEKTFLGFYGSEAFALFSSKASSRLVKLPLGRFLAGPFVRGDVNQDGRLTVSDSIAVLRYLFPAGDQVPACLDACDMNDDGRINVADPVYLLGYLFADGPAVPPPAGSPPAACGPDPTADSLGCEIFSPCR